jgi:hypothetical protein
MANTYDFQGNVGEGVTGVGYGEILGAPTGGQNLQEIFDFLGKILMTGGYFGTDYTGKEGMGKTFADVAGKAGGGQFADIMGMGQDYDLTNVSELLEQQYGKGVITDPTAEQGGMQSLLNMLQGTKIPSITGEYRQDIGDIKSEVGSQLQALISGRNIEGKSGRYGNIASGARNVGVGGRGKFMSDYYGLQEKQFEMQKDIQADLEEEFMGNIGQWMNLNPYVL